MTNDKHGLAGSALKRNDGVTAGQAYVLALAASRGITRKEAEEYARSQPRCGLISAVWGKEDTAPAKACKTNWRNVARRAYKSLCDRDTEAALDLLRAAA